ncbi:MAG: 4'-phosphopantetheinyl transferase family protein [Moraxellaceae bacterium]
MTSAHILWLRDEAQPLSPKLKNRLDAEEQARLADITAPSRQRSFLLSRLLLRQLLATHLPAESLRFARADSGRLLLTGNSGWHISLSHASTGIAVIAAQRPCGIDIETPRAVAMEKIAARYFSAQENEALQACPPSERTMLFFRLWTLKEASVKALGEGLAGNLALLAFDVRGEQAQQYASGPALQLWQTQAAPHLIAAAVSGSEPVQWHKRQLSIAELEAI